MGRRSAASGKCAQAVEVVDGGRAQFPAVCCQHLCTHHLLCARPPPLQLFSWPGSSASVAFQGATAVTVVLDATIANLPAGDRWLGNLSNTNIEVPNAVFQVSAAAPPAASWCCFN